MSEMIQNVMGRKKGRYSRGTIALMIVILGGLLLWMLCHADDIANGVVQMGMFLKYTFIQRALIVGMVYATVALIVSVFPALVGILAQYSLSIPFCVNLGLFVLLAVLSIAICRLPQDE